MHFVLLLHWLPEAMRARDPGHNGMMRSGPGQLHGTGPKKPVFGVHDSEHASNGYCYVVCHFHSNIEIRCVCVCGRGCTAMHLDASEPSRPKASDGCIRHGFIEGKEEGQEHQSVASPKVLPKATSQCNSRMQLSDGQ
uniref:Putative secreted protein n=1 Tax=Anopheles darlingi TaxID=43151 RepID=A0A2M4DA46_ANODA